MARPQKEGIDYFSLDVNMFTESDDKTYFLYSKYGLEGVGIIVKLLQKIYGDKGFYKKWGEREAFLFSKQINVDINIVHDLVNDCINEEFFNKNMFTEHKILTSTGIQKRYFKAAERRKGFDYETKYLLINPENVIKKVNVSNNPVNVNNNVQNVDNNPQSKVKESKVKESKVEERKEEENALLPKSISDIKKFYEENGFGLFQGFVLESVNHYLDDGITADVILLALEEAKRYNALNWAYVEKILNRCFEFKVFTAEQFEAQKKMYQEKKSKGPKNRDAPMDNRSNFKQREYEQSFFDGLYEEI